jgi:chromate transport protein ChrA
MDSQIDWIAITITITAFIALFRFKVGIMSVIFLSGAIGLSIGYFG